MPSDNTNKQSDTKHHSRGDNDDDPKRKSSRGSGRSSTHRPSSSTSSRSRPSDSKEHLRSESRGGESTPGANHVTEGSSRSSHSRSKTARPSDEKEKHRSSSQGFSSPGASSVRSSNDRASRKASSDSKIKEKARSSSGPASTPGASAVKSLGDRRSKKESSKGSGSSSPKTPDSNRIKRERQKLRLADGDAGNDRSLMAPAPPLIPEEAMPEIKATTVSDIEELVQDPSQEERRELRSSSQVGEIVVASSANDRDGRTKKRNMFIAAFCIFAILAAGIATWIAVASPFKSSDAAVTQSESSPKPSEEACEMVSKGLMPSITVGQNETKATSFGIELSFVVSPEENIDLLQRELGFRMQQNVLPALLGCPTGTSITIENTFIAILAAIINDVSVGNPTQCVEGSSGQLCSTVSFEIDVFVEDGEAATDALINLIRDLYQDSGLLELLDLATPVEKVYFKTIVAIAPTMFPSPSPSISDGEPTSLFDDCLAIANGEPVKDQDTMATQENDILLDVSLESTTMSLTPITIELTRKIQQVIMPSLAGCPDEEVSRLLRTQTGIANGFVQAQHDSEGCMEESPTPCYRYKINLYLHVSQGFKFADFTEMIVADFKKAPLVQRLDLSVATFVNIAVVEILAQTPSSSPSVSPSQSPTLPPTSTPSKLPSTAPTNRPSLVPSAGPTAQPVVDPTPLPTPAPTPTPTPGPTLPPTPGPTQPPTPEPTPGPTEAPITASPTKPPTPFPTALPSKSPSMRPSSSPTLAYQCFQSNEDLRDAVGTPDSPNWSNETIVSQYGPIGDWCFGPGVTSMYELFRAHVGFNEDISRWDTSGITDMFCMFCWNPSFNQNIGNWNTSSVTNMAGMFWYVTDFNQDVGNWDTSKVTQMNGMFSAAENFNQDLSRWDVSRVTTMEYMFWTSSFNYDISNWDVSSVTTMFYMLGRTPFNYNLCAWGSRVPSSLITSAMFIESGCPTTSSPWMGRSPPGPFCHVCT